MKKSSILGLCLIAGVSASAQMSLVKDVEHSLKGGSDDLAAALVNIQPALTNDESKGEAQTWFVAGKAGFELYDNLYAKKSIGQNVDGKQAGDAIVKGYEYMMTALPLDTIVDAKGKTKTKYSKDIVKTIAGHYNDFSTAAVLCWEAKDYPGAYKAWGIWVDLPNNKSLGKNAPAAPADSVVSEMVYNMALAAWQMDSIPLALENMKRAKSMGYKKKNLYDYAISLAAQSKNNALVYELAEEAYPLYGKEDPKFLQLMINSRIENEKYDEAKQMLENAISADPNNAQLYNIMGILYEAQKDNDNAIANYRKATELDAKFAQSQYNLGRKLCEKAYAISDGASNLSQADYNKLVETEINPLFREAAEHLEAAYSIDPDNGSDALRYLRNVYYNLHDEENLKRVESL